MSANRARLTGAMAVMAIFCALAPAALPAEGPAKYGSKGGAGGDASVTFSWSPVEGAGGYTVELTTPAGEQVASLNVAGTTATISAPPGDYLIRVVSLNHFMRPESASPWKKISIVRKGKPQVEMLDPISVEPGAKARVVLKGKNLDASTAVSLRRAGDKAAIIPLSVRTLDANRIELLLPPIEVGLYSLELRNKPDYSVVLPDALAVKHRPPVIASVEPASLDLLAPPLRFKILGSDIAPGASISLEIDGRRVDISSAERSEGELRVELASAPEAGSYDLVIENDPLSFTRAASALRFFSSASPATAATAAQDAPAASIAATPAAAGAASAAAQAPAPAVAIAQAAPNATPPSTGAAAIRPAAAPTAISPATPAASSPAAAAGAQASAAPTATASAAPADSATKGGPSKPLVSPEAAPQASAPQASAPPQTQAAAPSIAAIPDSTAAPQTAELQPPEPIAPANPAAPKAGFSLPPEPWSFGAGWAGAFALGDWAQRFSPSLVNADLSARLCLMASRAEARSSSLRLGTELRAEASFFSSKAGDATYVGSSFSSFGLQAGAWAALAWPRIETTLGASAGIAYSRIKVSNSNLDPNAVTSGHSVDPAASASLELAWKPAKRLAVGLRIEGGFIFFSDRTLIAVSPGSFARIAF